MVLDDKFKQLQGLKVCCVEDVIGNIERTKLDHSDVSRDYEQELRDYSDLVGEKLKRVIENIYSLTSPIFGLEGGTYSFYPVKVAGNSKRILISKDMSNNVFGLCIEDFMKNLTWFMFERDFTPRDIIFSTYSCLTKPGERDHYEYIPKIKDRDVEGFVDKFKNLLIDYHQNPSDDRERHDIDSVPHVLNLVPSLLSSIYEEEREKQKKKLQILQLQKGMIVSLIVPREI